MSDPGTPVNCTRLRSPAFYLAGEVCDNLSLVPEVVLVPHQDDRGGHLVLEVLQYRVILVWLTTLKVIRKFFKA